VSGHQESVLVFRCGDEHLAGILSTPSVASDIAVLVVVGGPQYRAGSHRQFVQLCRRIADAGHTALRFDYRGMGDSGGPLRNFEHVSDDIGAAVDALLGAAPGLRRVVLWGLCDGASAALLYQQERRDPRVAGLCLINPWVRSDASLARTQLKHYYLDRLRQREFWLKLLSGKVAGQALKGLFASLRAARSAKQSQAGSVSSYQQHMAAALRGFDGPVQILLSEHDYTAKEFADCANSDPDWITAMRHARPLIREMAGADHTCSQRSAQEMLERWSVEWLNGATMHKRQQQA